MNCNWPSILFSMALFRRRIEAYYSAKSFKFVVILYTQIPTLTWYHLSYLFRADRICNAVCVFVCVYGCASSSEGAA